MKRISHNPGRVEWADGIKLRCKGCQLVKNGQQLKLSLPGGGGYGAAKDRDRDAVENDLNARLITAQHAKEDYGLEG